MAELIFQGDEYDLTAGPLPADHQSGGGYFRTVLKLFDIFTTAQLFLKLRA